MDLASFLLLAATGFLATGGELSQLSELLLDEVPLPNIDLLDSVLFLIGGFFTDFLDFAFTESFLDFASTLATGLTLSSEESSCNALCLGTTTGSGSFVFLTGLVEDLPEEELRLDEDEDSGFC